MAVQRGILAAATLLAILPGLLASRNVFGSCPDVEPMKDFNMTRFEGTWYVKEIFDNRVRCLTWHISKQGEGIWHIRETKDSGLVGEYNGRITSDGKTSGDLTVSWDMNIGGRYPFTVFTTDYDSYAGVFMCQQVWFYNRQEGVILSRTPGLHIQKIQQTRGTIRKFGVAVSYFMEVDQSHCPKLDDTTDPSDDGGDEDFDYDEDAEDAFGGGDDGLVFLEQL